MGIDSVKNDFCRNEKQFKGYVFDCMCLNREMAADLSDVRSD